MDFLIDHYLILLEKTGQHIFLSGASLILAIMIAVPWGVLTYRFQGMKSISLSVANIFQTIPSLALLALFIPLLGIGLGPTILACTIYSILPILRNTMTGLQEVPDEMIEAADGLGFTKLQRLLKVELPLALPTIIAGIRIGASMTIGIATIAAFIGAGGLGDFITQGLALNNSKLILLGAIPAAILALAVNFLISRLEKNRHGLKIAFGLFLGLLIIIGSNLAWNALLKEEKITVASKNFTEQIILAELISQVIEQKTSMKVVRKFNLGTSDIVHQALLNGEVDLYPEYTGTAYLTILHEKNAISSHDLFNFVKDQYDHKYNLVWIEPLGFSNSQSLAVKSEFAKKYGLSSISDIKSMPFKLQIAAPAEFIKRADALPALVAAYDLEFGKILQVDPMLMYDAIKDSQVNVIASFSTDGRLFHHDFVLLEDDRNVYPSYDAAIVARHDMLNRHPEIHRALRALTGKISMEEMQRLNSEVDIYGRSPKEVAREFLKRLKLAS